MKWLKIALFLFLSTFTFTSQAQQFGAIPPSSKWEQINSDTLRLIFSPSVDSQAHRISSIIHRMAKENTFSLGNKLRKINTVLHNNTTLANGYVFLAPFRSEYYLIPPSNIFELGANPWLEELAVHEYRHVQQFSNFNNGIAKVASYIFGEEGQALFNVMAIPDWFFEGDAVHAESALTQQGRGRTPYFFNGYNSLFREQRNYSWMKLRNGSMKDFVPNHYSLGYLLVNYGYLKYGNDFWRKVTQDATAFRGLIYPFQKAIKKYSGVDYKTFRTQALEYYSHEVSKRRTDKLKPATVTNYYFPQFIADDSLLYLKSSYKNIPAFFIKDKRGEHKIKMRNISSEEWFSYRNGRIAYTGYDVNARWNLKDYSNIYLLDIHTGIEKKITANSKYFTPDISPSGQKIIAVSFNDSTEAELHILKTDGSIENRIRPDKGSLFVHPKFIDENTIVVAERLANSMMTLTTLHLATGEKEELIPPGYFVIGYPSVHDGSVYFVASASGNDDIFSVRLKDKKIFQIEPGLTGHYFPNVYKNDLTFSSFTSNGLQIKSQQLPANGGKELPRDIWKQSVIPYPVAGAENSPNLLSAPTRQFSVAPYKKGSHLFNFHSWSPDYTDPELTFSLFSDNVLNTFSNDFFYRYNLNETSHAIGANLYYGGLFPVLNAGATYTYDRTIKTVNRTFTVNDMEARVGYSIPLNFTSGKTYKALNFGTNFIYNRSAPTGIYKDSLQSNTSTYLSHFITWSQQLPKAVQHIYPKFGYAVGLYPRHLIKDKGYQFLANGRIYLPSFGNHSMVLGASIQETDTLNKVFSNRFANARGYGDFYFSRMWKVSANYHMPLFYPDWGFGNIIYFQRLRTNVFYDMSRVYSKDKLRTRDLTSVGAEIYFDSKIWNALPVSFGFRVSHLLNDDFGNRKKGTNIFEFILPVDFIPGR